MNKYKVYEKNLKNGQGFIAIYSPCEMTYGTTGKFYVLVDNILIKDVIFFNGEEENDIEGWQFKHPDFDKNVFVKLEDENYIEVIENLSKIDEFETLRLTSGMRELEIEETDNGKFKSSNRIDRLFLAECGIAPFHLPFDLSKAWTVKEALIYKAEQSRVEKAEEIYIVETTSNGVAYVTDMKADAEEKINNFENATINKYLAFSNGLIKSYEHVTLLGEWYDPADPVPVNEVFGKCKYVKLT